MVHLRLNDPNSNPNPHVNFITVLSRPNEADETEARDLLRALAAQVRPLMKRHGFTCNSLEEYEYNTVFAGRNWENGQVIELVLRRANGSFYPIWHLLNTFCHELAHIKHMNHGRAFQALWTRVRNEVSGLRRKGYYGDGFWSNGKTLGSGRASSSTQVIPEQEFPEYTCGGAQARQRPASLKRKGAGKGHRRDPIPSEYTGAQPAKRRKAGSRVRANVFDGNGVALNAGIADDAKKKVGTGFRKQATSKSAREARALAAEARFRARAGPSKQDAVTDESSASDDDDVLDNSPENNGDRLKALLDCVDFDDLCQLKSTKHEPTASPEDDDIEIPSWIDEEGRDLLNQTKDSGFGKTKDAPKGPSLKRKNMVEDEIRTRKREVLGLDGSRKLGIQRKVGWACGICTFMNEEMHLACSMCATPRSQ